MNKRCKGVPVILINGNDKTFFPSIRRAASFLEVDKVKVQRLLASGKEHGGFKIIEKSKLKENEMPIS